MLTHPVSKALWSKLARMTAQQMADNSALVARCALTVYRKCGRAEALQFISLIRLALCPVCNPELR